MMSFSHGANVAFAAAKRPVKSGMKFVVSISGHFRASFPEARGPAKFRHKFHGSGHGDFYARFQEKFHGSTSASLAETTLRA